MQFLGVVAAGRITSVAPGDVRAGGDELDARNAVDALIGMTAARASSMEGR